MRRFLALLFCLLLAWPSQAAVTANSAVTPQTPKFPHVQVTTTTLTALYACGTNGTKVTGMFASSTCTTADDITISVLTSGTTYVMNRVTIPINAGNVAGTPPISLLWAGLPIDSDGNPYFFCQSGDTLQMQAAAVTGCGALAVFVVAADF